MADDVKPADDKSGNSSGDDEDKKVSNGSPGADDKNTKDKAPDKFTFDRAKGEYTKTDLENIILGDSLRKKELKEIKEKMQEIENKNLSEDEKAKKELEELRTTNVKLTSERKLSKIEAELAGSGVKPRFAKLVEVDSIENIPGAVKKFVEENPELVSGDIKKADVKVPDIKGGSPVTPAPGDDKAVEIQKMYDNAVTEDDILKADKAYAEHTGRPLEDDRRRRL